MYSELLRDHIGQHVSSVSGNGSSRFVTAALDTECQKFSVFHNNRFLKGICDPAMNIFRTARAGRAVCVSVSNDILHERLFCNAASFVHAFVAAAVTHGIIFHVDYLCATGR